MDHRRFDLLVRTLGGAVSRRGAVAALLGLAAGEAASAGEAKRARRRCRPACADGQRCVRGACVCDEGTTCGASCCRTGQRCEGGQCVTEPDPGACIAFGQPCKNVGRRCCEGLSCASGQGGMADIACRVPAGGECTATAECVYGADCVGGACIARPEPAPTGCQATGGVISTNGIFRVHTFAADGVLTFATPCDEVEYLVVAGGGGGGWNHGGGGGAGGVKTGTMQFSAGAVPVAVGPGGAGATEWAFNGQDGGNSTLNVIVATGGGGGGSGGPYGDAGRSGGSGGGGGGSASGSGGTGGQPTAGQGFAGGAGGTSGNIVQASGGGGGGARALGTAGTGSAPTTGGNGGEGISANISGAPTVYGGGGGGGGGGGLVYPVVGPGGSGGSGGGGAGGGPSNADGASGQDGLGGGGGGGGASASSLGGQGGRGGSGIVIVRYRTG